MKGNGSVGERKKKKKTKIMEIGNLHCGKKKKMEIKEGHQRKKSVCNKPGKKRQSRSRKLWGGGRKGGTGMVFEAKGVGQNEQVGGATKKKKKIQGRVGGKGLAREDLSKEGAVGQKGYLKEKKKKYWAHALSKGRVLKEKKQVFERCGEKNRCPYRRFLVYKLKTCIKRLRGKGMEIPGRGEKMKTKKQTKKLLKGD